MLMQFVFYVNNITSSVINTKYTIFMPTHHVYSTNTPIYLTLFPGPYLSRASTFLLVNIPFYFRQRFFCLFVLLVVFASILDFYVYI